MRHGDRDRKTRISPFLAFCHKKWAAVVEEMSGTDVWSHDACKAEIVRSWRKLLPEKKERYLHWFVYFWTREKIN